MHMQCWVKEVNPKTRDDMFHDTSNIHQRARLQFYSYVDKVMYASYGKNLAITHRLELKLLFSENITLARRKVIFGFTE